LYSLLPAQVKAFDGDRDQPEALVYKLSGEGIDDQEPDKRSFEINSKTGEIHVLRPLDRDPPTGDRKSTRLNSSHVSISYAVSFLCVSLTTLFPYTTLFRSLIFSSPRTGQSI